MRKGFLKLIFLISVFVSIVIAVVLINSYTGFFAQLLPLKPIKEYATLKQALKDSDYQKYPANFLLLPKMGYQTDIWYNPKTKEKLELDTTEGGGSACCEQATFYVWFDKKENIFWVNTWQAGFGIINENGWYGPFKLK